MHTSTSITTLPASPDQARRRRFRRYVVQMILRVVLFVGGVLMYLVWHTWLCVFPLLIATVLPWIAVVFANAGDDGEASTITAPAGAVTRYDAPATAERDAEEARRAAAYRAEQERLRHEAQAEQAEWQRSGDRSRVWGHR